MFLQKIIITAAVLLIGGCGGSALKREEISPQTFSQYPPPKIADLQQDSPYLKAHMKDGGLYVFEMWKIDEEKLNITGKASRYDATRAPFGTRDYTVSIDSIALVETNILITSGATVAIAVFTGIEAAISVACFSNPKACFGSCPTFYASDGDSMHLQAEGFSSSISPSLEETDIDALYLARPSDGALEVEMRNEALETHAVRWVDVLAVPRGENKRVFHGDDGKFWHAEKIVTPVSATGPEGTCLHQVSSPDGNERCSLADSLYLAEKETIDLEFDAPPGHKYGLVVGGRQSLLTTYLLYQMYAYMGKDVGHWFAEVERNTLGSEVRTMEHIMGGIDVLTPGNGDEWQVNGSINERGPLAMETRVVPLQIQSSADGRLRVRLRMTKGAWRIDYLALAEVSDPVEPTRLRPAKVMREGQEVEMARQLLLDSSKVLTTLPGDRYTLSYKIPDADKQYEFFLESRGYYLEWIRKEWIAEENQMHLAEMIYMPESALRRLAPEFKKVEATMEESFWRSRYAKP